MADDQQTRRHEARRRALRAARAVTMGLALAAAGPACSSSHGPGEDASMPSDAEADSGDDPCSDGATASDDRECCEATGGTWSGGACAIPGPFVPPSMEA